MAALGNGTVFTSAPLVASTSQALISSAFVVDTTTGTSVSFFTSAAPSDPTSSTAAVTPTAEVVQFTATEPGTTHVVTSVQSAGATDPAGNVASEPSTVVITSTQPPQIFPSETTKHSSTTPSTSTTSTGSLSTAGASSSSTGGLSAGGKIAVAVVVPVVAVALIVLAALFLWRRRKQRKDAEELRRKEVEEYGFNPNNDPTLPVIGGASPSGDDPSEMREADGAGYRGWGTTSTGRKPSTNLSSGAGAIGVARSTSNSDNGRYNSSSPTAGTNKSSDVQSGDPLVGSPSNGRPMTADSETIGALGAVPSNGNRQDINRGPSNASSAYSGAHRSDTSGEGAIPGGAPNQQYYNDGMYYDEGMPQHGPYGDGSYGGGQPVVRDVSARRNTRIENPSVIPHQGTAGIAQNF